MTQVNVGAGQNVNEALKNQKPERPVETAEKAGEKAENFQKFVNQAQTAANQTSLTQAVDRPYANEGAEKFETNPTLGEESTASQKSGSATDQEKKRQQQRDDEVEEVGATGKKSSRSKGGGSLMEELSKMNTDTSKTSVGRKDIRVQTQETIDQIEKAKKQLADAKTEIKPSYQALLNNRLSHIDDNLKIALSKAGLEHTPPPSEAKVGNNPIKKFLGYLTHSQDMMEKLQTAIVDLNANNQMTPANLLAIQIKVGFIQQQIELFTSLLNKALESTKTIMNVQV